MSYLIFYKNQVYGCYGKIDLVRANLLILLFKLLEKNEISKIIYENLTEYLIVKNFSISNFNISELKNELRSLDIRIEKITHESSSGCALEHILEHVKYRFNELDQIMEKDARVKVTFPGKDAQHHELGTMYKDQWELFDKENCDKVFKALYDFISMEIEKLEDKYDERINYGEVYYQKANALNYQVWSANAVNWNRPEGLDIPGSFQAQEMKFQEKGVFGIVVTPRYGYKNLVPAELKGTF
jgi:hypothetical protein